MTDEVNSPAVAVRLQRPVGPLVPERWYCVSETGEAELMENETDAQAAASFQNGLPGRSGYRALRLVSHHDLEQLIQHAARYLWHRERNPAALLATAWGASKAACAIGADCDAATDAAMRERPNVKFSRRQRVDGFGPE